MITTKQLDEWEELAKGAYREPWCVSGPTGSHVYPQGEDGFPVGIDAVCNCQVSGMYGYRKTSEFIAASREAVPALIAEVRDLLESLGGRCECGHWGKDHVMGYRWCDFNDECNCHAFTPEATE